MSTDNEADVVVIGAGVVGLAVARELALRGREVIVLERHGQPGQETSSRNSGVIHSGIYYPKGSLKARLCVAGRDRLYAYCEARGIAYSRCGKLIVAQENQLQALREIEAKGQANGVADLVWISADEVHEREPVVRCAAALWSPSTGIVDVHELMTAYEGDLESHGGMIAYETDLLGAAFESGGFTLTARSGSESSSIRCRALVNSAGLHAVDLMKRIEGYPQALQRKAFFAKGNYFVCQGQRPFRHLVYPIPSEAGLGTHATLDLDGTTRFGPDVEWIDGIDYSFDASRVQGFYDAIREYWPGLPDGALVPGYTGIRPKLVGPDSKAADFVIEGPAVHGIDGLVNLLGIESPGLTSSLAIADQVADLL